MDGNELYYEEDGVKKDAELHAELLAGDHSKAISVSINLMRKWGFSEDDIAYCFPSYASGGSQQDSNRYHVKHGEETDEDLPEWLTEQQKLHERLKKEKKRKRLERIARGLTGRSQRGE